MAKLKAFSNDLYLKWLNGFTMYNLEVNPELTLSSSGRTF